MALTRITKGVIKPNENYDTHNINSTGIVTAIGLDINGNGDISGDLNVGGVLTYEDVTSIDSIGIITARGGIDCNGDLDVDGHTNLDNVSIAGVTTASDNIIIPDNKKLILGSLSGRQLHIYHNTSGSSNHVIESTSSSNHLIFRATTINPRADTFSFRNYGHNKNVFRVLADTSTTLFYNGNEKLTTENTGVNITGIVSATSADINGDLDVDGHTNLDNVSIAGVTTFASNIYLGDNDRIHLGADNDMILWNDGSNGLLYNNTGNFFIRGAGGLTIQSNSIRLRNDGNTEDLAKFTANGAVELYYDDTKTFSTNSLGISVYQRLVCEGTAPSILLSDTNHQSYTITADANALNITDANNGNRLSFNANGSISAYGFFNCNNSVYAANGFSTNGNIDIDDDGDKLRIGAGNDLQIYHSTFNYIESHNDSEIHINANTGGSVENMAKFKPNGAVELYHNGIKQVETASSAVLLPDRSTNTGRLAFGDLGTRIEGGGGGGADDGLYFMTNSVMKWQMNPDGDLIPSTAGAVDIGSASKEIGNVYIADDKKITLGTGDDFEISHSGGVNFLLSPNNRQLQLKGDGGLLIRAGGNQNIANFLQSGVTLYHSVGNAYTARFVTTSTGITVTGEVTATQDYPQSDPNIDFVFTKVKKLDPRLTYRRSGTASYVDKNGMLKMVGDNVPRFDHDPVTKECKGLLLEPAAVNRMSSAEFDWANLPYIILTANSNYNSARTGFSADTLAPDGSKWTMRVSWQGSTFSSNGYLRVGSNSIGSIAAGDYTASFFVKRGLDGKHNLDSLLDGTSGIGQSQYHWAMEQYSPSYSAANANLRSSTTGIKIQKFQNGWYRISVPVTVSNTFSPQRTGVSHYVLNAGSHETFWKAMDFYYWGFQFEEGSEVTSYMGTASQYTNNTATGYGNNIRGADSLFMDGQDFKDFYNVNESSVVMQYTLFGGSTYQGQSRAFRMSAESGADTRIDFVNKTNEHPYLAADGSAVIGATGLDAGDVLFQGQTNKIALKVKHQDFASTINGGTVATNTSGSWPPTNKINLLTLGAYDKVAGGGLKGHIQRFTYYPVGLTNNQLVTLTS